jgi:hypothetical protein
VVELLPQADLSSPVLVEGQIDHRALRAQCSQGRPQCAGPASALEGHIRPTVAGAVSPALLAPQRRIVLVVIDRFQT